MKNFGWWLMEKLVCLAVYYCFFFFAGLIFKIFFGNITWPELLIGPALGALAYSILEWMRSRYAVPVVIVRDDRRDGWK